MLYQSKLGSVYAEVNDEAILRCACHVLGSFYDLQTNFLRSVYAPPMDFLGLLKLHWSMFGSVYVLQRNLEYIYAV